MVRDRLGAPWAVNESGSRGGTWDGDPPPHGRGGAESQGFLGIRSHPSLLAPATGRPWRGSQVLALQPLKPGLFSEKLRAQPPGHS